MKLSNKTIEQVKENKALIESKNWLKIWETLRNPELNGAFVELGYNPLSGLKEIPPHYFSGSLIKIIEIPNSVTSIGRYAFGDCTSLKSVTIPDSVKFIGWCAFSGCDLLADIVYRGSIKEFMAIGKSEWWNYKATKVICNDGEISLI